MKEVQLPQKQFSFFHMWAMSFGCCVGWGAYVLPGTVFLPMAGPVGASFALFFGALVMIVVGANYHFLAVKMNDVGGAFTYVRRLLGADHAFLCAWFLWLVYAAIIWANASAFAILVRKFFGDSLLFGFHYDLAGYTIYFGEIVATVLLLFFMAALCMYKNKVAIWVNTFFAVLLFFGVLYCFYGVYQNLPGLEAINPPILPDKSSVVQLFSVVALTPWAYVGFESVSHVTPEMSCNSRKFFLVVLLGILTAAVVYTILIFIGAAPLPGVTDWATFSQYKSSEASMVEMPVLLAVKHYLGTHGVMILGLSVLGAIATGLFGFCIVLSRLTCALADKRILPNWFRKRTQSNVPRNAIFFICILSILMSFVGRTAIGWIVDINNICATVVYFYVSLCAYLHAKHTGKKLFCITGALGLFFSVCFCLFTFMPNFWEVTVVATESYLIFSLWGLIGLIFLFCVFKKDKKESFGRTSLVWLALLTMIFVSQFLWMRQEVQSNTLTIVKKISDFYQTDLKSLCGSGTEGENKHNIVQDHHNFINQELEIFSSQLVKHSIMQMIIVLVTIAMIFAVYSLMHARRREIEMQRIKAEEVSRSKSAFLSHMSHDIRTPMNAIIGFTDLSLTKQDINVVHDYLQKIKLSSNHLLSLINDVLEMSRIESGKVDIEPIPVSIPELLHNLSTIILGQMEAKQHSFDLNALNVRNENILCDKLRLNQILLNLLSNAIKYTPAGGVITFTVSQLGDAENGYAKYEFRVKDNGMGMTKEFAAKIFEAFEREQNSAVNKIQGTGLGMAITKHLVDLMGGEITVETEKDKGSEFILNFQFPILTDQSPIKKLPELKGMHVLVVDDEYGSCDAITSILTDMEVRSEWTMFGKEAILRNADAAKRGDPFKVCIIDWKMPDMSGIKVASEVIHTEAHPAVILVTAYDWMNIKEEAVEAGIKAFCNKPVFASELAAAFEVALNAEAEKQENVSEQESMDFSGKRVLLVDDIEVNREISTAMLEMKGILVEYACNGQEAVEKVQAAEPGYYDVVLMDVQMPIMDGYQATKAIRALPNKDLARVPIVAMTANAFDEDRQAALAAGMDGHVAKPIDVEKLFKMLKDIL